MIKTALFAAAAAIATIATAAPALAKDVPVFYGDLDLASAKGQSTLSHRIHRAAKQACDFKSEGRQPSQSALACYKQAKASARTEMASIVEDTRLGG
jgi:UrcA family protein